MKRISLMTRIGLAQGSSFGSIVALAIEDKRIKAMAITATPLTIELNIKIFA